MPYLFAPFKPIFAFFAFMCVVCVVIEAREVESSSKIAELPTIAELYQGYLKANGGLSSLQALQSIRIHAQIKTPGQPTRQLTHLRKRPEMMRSRIRFEDGIFESVYNEGQAWSVTRIKNKDPVYAEISGDLLLSMQQNSQIDGFFFMSKGQSDFGEVVAEENVLGGLAYRIEVNPDKKLQFNTIWLSKENFQEVKSASILPDKETNGSKLVESFYSDFSKINGVHFAQKVQQFEDGEWVSDLVIDKVSANIGIFDSLFRRPAELD